MIKAEKVNSEQIKGPLILCDWSKTNGFQKFSDFGKQSDDINKLLVRMDKIIKAILG